MACAVKSALGMHGEDGEREVKKASAWRTSVLMYDVPIMVKNPGPCCFVWAAAPRVT